VAAGASVLSTLAMPADAHAVRLITGTLVVMGTAGLVALVWPPFRRDVLAIATFPTHLHGMRGAGRPATLGPGGPVPDLPHRADGLVITPDAPARATDGRRAEIDS
jgi:PST family polysaccharide transporter